MVNKETEDFLEKAFKGIKKDFHDSERDHKRISNDISRAKKQMKNKRKGSRLIRNK